MKSKSMKTVYAFALLPALLLCSACKPDKQHSSGNASTGDASLESAVRAPVDPADSLLEQIDLKCLNDFRVVHVSIDQSDPPDLSILLTKRATLEEVSSALAAELVGFRRNDGKLFTHFASNKGQSVSFMVAYIDPNRKFSTLSDWQVSEVKTSTVSVLVSVMPKVKR